MKCPKYSYERKPTDHAPEWQCPSCGVAYVKVLQVRPEAPSDTADVEDDRSGVRAEGVRPFPIWRSVVAVLTLVTYSEGDSPCLLPNPV